MKESYECEVATHIGPESCGAAREGGVEALKRERAVEEVLRIGSRDSVSALEVSPSRSVDSADTTEVIRLA
jgi:hypothetical protein